MNLIQRALNWLFPTPAKKELSREIAPVRMTGTRRILTDRIATGLRLDRLNSLLQAAAEGDAHDYLTLAEEMEEKALHYAGVLGTRKRAVLGLSRRVEAASDDAADVKLADAVRDSIVRADGFGPLLAALLDALGKGYSAVEIGWDTKATPWRPVSYAWRDPRYFRYDRDTGTMLRLLDDANPSDGIELPPCRFIVHTPRLKMGLPIRGGLARLVAVTWLCGVYIQEDWLSFAEVFGMPLRIGRFGSSATDADKDALKNAVMSLGSDAAAILHDSMQIEFQAASPGAGGADLYERLLDRLDKLISKAVLGRSDAADATSGKLGNEQQFAEIRADILESDACELAATINAHLVRPFIDLNFGPQDRYPVVVLDVPDQEDLAGLADMLAKLVPLGLKVEQSVIRDKWGLPDPAEGAELLTPSPPTPLPQAGEGSLGGINRALNRLPSPTRGRGAGGEGGFDPTAPLLERLGQEAEPLINTLLDPVRAALEDSADLMDFRDKLLTLYPDLDGKAFANLMGEALAAAEAMGRFEAALPSPSGRGAGGEG